MPTVAEALPEMDTLTAEQTEMVTAFVAANLPAGQPLPLPYKGDTEEDCRITAYKYLTARKWVMEDATKMFNDAVEYRREVRFDDSPVFPSPIPIRGYDPAKLNEVLGLPPREPTGRVDAIHAVVKAYHHFGFHYWDKTGHPVVIDCTGSANVKQLVAKYKEMTPPGKDVAQAAIDLHTYQNIVGAKLVKYQDKIGAGKEADGRRITSATIIMDCRGLTLAQLFGESVDIIKKAWSKDALYFPEGMHRMFVVNCPSMIMVAYNLFKGIVDKRTQEKVTFCNEKDTPEVLRTVIEARHLPKFLGGECECENGCVNEKVDIDPATLECASPLLGKTSEVTVAAGKAFEKKYNVSDKCEFVWNWESVTGSDVEFSVVYTPKEGKPVKAKEPTKLSKDESSFSCPSAGSVLVRFDNTFSWMKEKQIRFRAFKVSERGADPASPTPASPTFPKA